VGVEGKADTVDSACSNTQSADRLTQQDIQRFLLDVLTGFGVKGSDWKEF